MKLAITGASGFLGSNLMKGLAADGHEIHAFVRDKGKLAGLQEPVKSVQGDITDRDALNEAFNGTDIVIHTVSNFRMVKGSDESYYQTNHQGTVAALEVARECGVKRFIHTSTIGVHGDVKQTPATESSPFNPGDLYQETKLLAEHECRAAAERGEMEVVIVRPTSQYGPGDMRMLKMFRMLQKGRFLLIGRCMENFHAVYIDDLVQGYRQIIDTPGLNGEVFFLGGSDYVSLQEYVDTAADALGVNRPGIRLPYWPIHFAGWLCEILCKPFGLEPPLHRRRVKFFKNNRAFDISHARQRLGYSPQVDLAEGMARTVGWYREQRLLD